ncbi:E3 ubiquitin-protein ligase [Colletotrichum shisoi]|uniref:E3 ubiquitin-protein ligase n=1 Tax=Colletotrichum shisoi TaxID=2078593 RepID=A0A5Q4C4Z1_9PEZI|nr:E3 ubiquitin-protein ligase [Colletotrichum shisoi]
MSADAETAEMTDVVDDVADDVADEAKRACLTTVLDVFPGICPDFLDKTAAKFQYNPDKTIEDILGLVEDGKPYPKRFYFKTLKRKREGPEDPDDEATILHTYNYPGRMKESAREYIVMAKKLLKQEFPSATMSSILKIFASKDNQLLPAYMAVDAAMKENQWSPGRVYVNIAYKKSPTSTDPQYEGVRLDNTIQLTNNPEEKRALQELQAVRKLLLKRKEFFCVGCAQQAAETAVGQSKYELACMSMDICEAGFSHQERQKFLTEQLSSALDRIENEAVLRMAGIENLERCPFCPYAAEYPPANTNREFRCDNPDCQKVSCRLCKEETHVPKTCEENTRDNGIKAKHEIEEAMSAAVIRKCNKWPLVGSPHRVHGSFRPSPERAEDMKRFAAPQYQPPPQAQQAQAPGPRQPGDFRGLHNVDDRRQLVQNPDSPEVNPFKRQINYQPQQALVRPDKEARPETPMSLMDLRKPMDRDKSVQRFPYPMPALPVSPQQESANRAQRPRGSLQDGWSIATHGRNHQGAQQSHNGERSVVADVCAEYLRKRDVRQLAADDQAPTVPDWISIWRQAVAKGNEPGHPIREEFTRGTEVGYGAVDVPSRAPEAAVPVAHAQSQSNGFNLNGLLQPPAPNRPNWLVEARRRGMARGMLEPAGGNSKDKPFVLD